jgi:hypothetical protein
MEITSGPPRKASTGHEGIVTYCQSAGQVDVFCYLLFTLFIVAGVAYCAGGEDGNKWTAYSASPKPREHQDMPTRIKDGQLVADPTAEQAHDAADTTIQRVQDLMSQLVRHKPRLSARPATSSSPPVPTHATILRHHHRRR